MADVTKLNRGMPRANRYQIFTSADAADGGGAVVQGDVLRVTDSLQRAARKIVIETQIGCDLGITLNSISVVTPRTDSIEGHRKMSGTGYEKMLEAHVNAGEIRSSNPEVTIGGGAIQEFTGPIDDIEITTWTVGAWTIRVQ